MQYVEGLRGEPAGRRLVTTADRRLQQKSHEWCGLEKPHAFDRFGNNVHTNIVASIVSRKEEEAGPS